MPDSDSVLIFLWVQGWPLIIYHHVYIGQLSTGKSMQDMYGGASVLGHGAKAIINFI